ncbi:hypothetical protein ACFQ0B_51125 [Nonomuraea thailandensis]
MNSRLRWATNASVAASAATPPAGGPSVAAVSSLRSSMSRS